VAGSTLAACVNHPRREAIGVCVLCRKRVCSECVTKVEGINYCVSCLAVLADAGQRSAAFTPLSPVRARLSAFAFLVSLSLLAWALVEAALPGA
jgi:hypothetical protein